MQNTTKYQGWTHQNESDKQAFWARPFIKHRSDILICPPITMFHHSLMVSTQEGYDFCITSRLQSLDVNPLFCKWITSDWKSVMSLRGALSTQIACKMVASIAPLTVMVVEYFNCATNGGRVLLLLHQRLGIPPSDLHLYLLNAQLWDSVWTLILHKKARDVWGVMRLTPRTYSCWKFAFQKCPL